MNNEPVAIRYDFDGYGYKYMDSGSGSDWQTRVQGEPLYTAPLQVEVGCAECGVNGGNALYCVACAEKFIGEAATKLQQKQETIEGLNRDYDLLFAEHQLLLKKEWVGLTDEEILAVNMSTVTKLIDEPIVCDTDHNIIQLGKSIEAKLKQKNGYAKHKNTGGKE